MTDKQPEALSVADMQELGPMYAAGCRMRAAAELRRQHALIAELVDALKQMQRWMPVYPVAADAIVGGRQAHKAAIEAAAAALSKAEAQQ